ncbi:MAG: hypothetical protein R3D84_03625 [Paracoccaceae bacterium]
MSLVLITAATAQWHDGELIRNSVSEGVTVRETTTERDCLIHRRAEIARFAGADHRCRPLHGLAHASACDRGGR